MPNKDGWNDGEGFGDRLNVLHLVRIIEEVGGKLDVAKAKGFYLRINMRYSADLDHV